MCWLLCCDDYDITIALLSNTIVMIFKINEKVVDKTL